MTEEYGYGFFYIEVNSSQDQSELSTNKSSRNQSWMKSTLIDEGFSIFVKKEFANEIEDLLNELKLKTQKIKFTIDEDIVAKIIEEEQENMLSNSSIYNCIFEIDNVSK